MDVLLGGSQTYLGETAVLVCDALDDGTSGCGWGCSGCGCGCSGWFRWFGDDAAYSWATVHVGLVSAAGVIPWSLDHGIIYTSVYLYSSAVACSV